MILSELKVGEKAVIESISHEEHMKQRLWDLGFTRSTVVEAIQESPSGDPIAYKVRGTIFAIRNNDAELITVRREAQHVE